MGRRHFLFAKKLLCIESSHPYLRDYPIEMFTEEEFMDGKDRFIVGKFYNTILKEKVINKVDGLLANIPKLENYEILYGMQEILSLFNNIHSRMLRIEDDEIYPFQSITIYDEERGFHVVGTLK